MAPLLWIKSVLRKWLDVTPFVPFAHEELLPPVEQVASQLVKRARQGDQVAMAQLNLTRDEAAKGNKQAKHSLQVITAYIKKHPVSERVTFGEELLKTRETDELANTLCAHFEGDNYPRAIINIAPEVAKRSLNKAVVTLANGPSLLSTEDDSLLAQLTSCLADPDCQKAFAHGVKNAEDAFEDRKSLSPQCRQALALGMLVGMARKLQIVRLPETPVSVLSPMVGWELGE